MKRALLSGAMAVTALLTGLGVGTTVALAAGDSPPPPPPWVNSDGTVDDSKMPDYAGVVDANGNVVKDKAGKPIKVKVDKGPPTLTPEQARGLSRADEVSRHRTEDGAEVVTVRPNLVAPGQNK